MTQWRPRSRRSRPRRSRRPPPIASARETLAQPACGWSSSSALLRSSCSFGLPALLDSYWMQVITGVVIYSIVTLGLGLLIGRVGMVSLCQFVLAAVGAWVALRLELRHRLPFPVLHPHRRRGHRAVIGTLIGLPALRLSGLYLALITLMAAGRDHDRPAHRPVPERRRRLLRQLGRRRRVVRLPRPSIATERHRLLPLLRRRRRADVPRSRSGTSGGKPGRAWAAIRQSQATAVAAGVNTVLYKLWAFALASFMAGRRRRACSRPPPAA